MSRLGALKATEIIAALLRGGFKIHHTRGSHYFLRHQGRPGLQLTVAHDRRELPPGTVRKIIRQAGLTEQEFRDLL